MKTLVGGSPSEVYFIFIKLKYPNANSVPFYVENDKIKVSLKVRKVMFETISYFKKALFQLDSLHQVYKYTVHFVPSVKLCYKTF